jgi:hypothetical protein
MQVGWRRNDIPELHGVPIAQRRQLWREAVARSCSARHLLVRFAAPMLGAVVFAGLGYLLWPTPLVWSLFGLLGISCVGAILECNIAQPRARRWLREHAGELDRYLSE